MATSGDFHMAMDTEARGSAKAVARAQVYRARLALLTPVVAQSADDSDVAPDCRD